MAGEGAGSAAQHGIDSATTQQHRGDQRGACAHSFAGERLRYAAAPNQIVVLAPSVLVAGIVFETDDITIICPTGCASSNFAIGCRSRRLALRARVSQGLRRQ